MYVVIHIMYVFEKGWGMKFSGPFYRLGLVITVLMLGVTQLDAQDILVTSFEENSEGTIHNTRRLGC
jgi:hypothetical protein